MTEDQIKHMVDRFLGWRLPENFYPDAGISFKAEFNENTPWPMRHQPTGTNLFDATQAKAMILYLVEGLPAATRTPPSPSAPESGEWVTVPREPTLAMTHAGYPQSHADAIGIYRRMLAAAPPPRKDAEVEAVAAAIIAAGYNPATARAIAEIAQVALRAMTSKEPTDV